MADVGITVLLLGAWGKEHKKLGESTVSPMCCGLSPCVQGGLKAVFERSHQVQERSKL